jgi:hypothetical protein
VGCVATTFITTSPTDVGSIVSSLDAKILIVFCVGG